MEVGDLWLPIYKQHNLAYGIYEVQKINANKITIITRQTHYPEITS